jgi:hypothetical protein
VSGSDPLHKQRSEWTLGRSLDIAGVTAETFRRNVHDGTLVAFAAEEPEGWHLSISFRDHRGGHSRYPTWDEQVHAVRALLPNDGQAYHMILPPDTDYVAVHETTFHWHEWKDYTE